MICDHQDFKLYAVSETCHPSASKKYLWSLLSCCVSCSLRKLVLIPLGTNSSPVHYPSMWLIWFQVEELLRGFLLGFSKHVKNCKQAPLQIQKASCRTGFQMLRSTKITDTDCNLNLISFCIATHRMTIFEIHFLTFISNTFNQIQMYTYSS